MTSLLDGLDPQQRAVAEAISGPVVVWAGAGTGKTRAVTHRMAHAVAVGAHDVRHGLAVTFTNRAAGQMRDRLHHLGVDGLAVRTFHSAALRQLVHFWPRVIGGTAPRVMPSTSALVAQAARSCSLAADPATVRDLAAEISWAKQMQIAPQSYVARSSGRTPPVDAASVARAFEAYESLKSDAAAIDFDDVLLLTVATLSDRPDVLDEVQAAYRWFTIDEFQDVSPLQSRLLDLWLGDRRDVCVVGDAAQTIYSFAGASDHFLLDFPNRFPEATAVRLYRCYRSTEPIVDLANRVRSVAERASDASIRLVSLVGPGPQPAVHSFSDEAAEARGIAQRIQSLLADGLVAREIAILVRVNAQMPALEEALGDLGIPVVLRGGDRFFDRPEVKEAMTRLRGAARSPDDSGAPVSEVVEAVLSAMGFARQAPQGTGAVRMRWESMSALLTLAESLISDGRASTLGDVVDELDRRSASQHAPQAEGVVIATIHAAKGLEWDAVVVAGAHEGALPHGQVTTIEGIAEERRLFYVAITRARRHVEITWSRSRQPGGRPRDRSRFLDELAVAMPEVPIPGLELVRQGSPTSRRASRQARPAECRTCGKALVTGAERARRRCRTCPSTADERLVEELRAWRLEQAREREVPAYVVFTDATLEALAEARPRDEDALLEISGIGPDKLARYGAQILDLLAAAEAPLGAGDEP